MNKTVTPIALEDKEDALDELIQSQMKEIEPNQTSDLRTGGYSDIDLNFEKKQSNQAAQNYDDDESDDMFDQMIEEQETHEMQHSDEDDGKDSLLENATDGIPDNQQPGLQKQPANSLELNMLLKQQIQDLENQQ